EIKGSIQGYKKVLIMGCGICASACPRKAIRLRHYSDKQVMAKTAVLCSV
ncbi:MAG: 4Fe-4S binding protein, partial [Dehalococcoidia bacterium]|nr:4Fe-4S binding protein [Dehalococcoidia bacterium]